MSRLCWCLYCDDFPRSGFNMMILEKEDADNWLLSIHTRGNLLAFVNDSYCLLGRWMRDEGGCCFGVGVGRFQRGETRVSSVDSLSEEDEVGFSLLPVKEIVHSFSPNLGLAFVARALIHLRMVDGMKNSLTSGVGWTIFCSFWVGTTWVAIFCFWRAICTNPSSSSSVSLRSFQPLWYYLFFGWTLK